MAIEIKELHIKIQVDEEKSGTAVVPEQGGKTKAFKAEIIRACTRNVLEILKEKQER